MIEPSLVYIRTTIHLKMTRTMAPLILVTLSLLSVVLAEQSLIEDAKVTVGRVVDLTGANKTCTAADDCKNATASMDDNMTVTELIDWIRTEGGSVDERQIVTSNNGAGRKQVVAREFIPAGTTLLSVPWEMILSIEDVEESDFCDMVEVLQLEFEEYEDEEDSWFAPYLKYLRELPLDMPAAWSEEGQDLLQAVMGETILPPIDGHLQYWQRTCPDTADLEDEAAVEAALHFIARQCPAFEISSENEHDDSQVQYTYAMMPFYDLYSHRVGEWCNTELHHSAVSGKKPFGVTASRDIQAGEAIYTCHGGAIETTNLFLDTGIIAQFPQHHSFTFHDRSADLINQKLSVAFDLDLNDDTETLSLTWTDGIHAPNRAWGLMKKELVRLQHVTGLVSVDATYLEAVPVEERQAILEYATTTIKALEAAMRSKDDPWPVTNWTIADYPVAGVNLADYNALSVEKKDSIEEPYKLFEDFDIGHLIQGDENWKDMIEYRRGLERPSLSFYVDKVARKRWLPTVGITQAKQYATMYGSELTSTGTVNDETRALFELLPNETDYAAKPSHHSEGSGVWLVSRDAQTNVTSFSSTARQLQPDQNESFDKWAVADALVKNLYAKARVGESETLRSVKPGFVVEERQVEVDHWDRAPVEFNMFVIWGRVWVGQINYIKGEGRLMGGWMYRNGTLAYGSQKSKYDYIDWPRLVNIAEKLGTKKDMFRVDIFVGVPAGSPSLRADATREERLAAIEYAVSECEIYPTTNFRNWQQLSQDAARLWAAGYKIGNYVTVPNTEVPQEFIETGFLSADFSSYEARD